MKNDTNLSNVLAARDERWAKLRRYVAMQEGIVVSATMNLPGPDKEYQMALRAFDLALQDMFLEFGSGFLFPLEKGSGAAGPYAFFLATPSYSAEKIKRLMVSFELTHPIGRWLDMDVWTQEGTSISRSALGFPPRKCMVCDHEARLCTKTRAHDMEQLCQITQR